MQEILDAILAEQYDAVGALDIPDHYRGVTVHADEVGMFEGLRLPGQGPPQVACTSTRCRPRSSARARRSSP